MSRGEGWFELKIWDRTRLVTLKCIIYVGPPTHSTRDCYAGITFSRFSDMQHSRVVGANSVAKHYTIKCKIISDIICCGFVMCVVVETTVPSCLAMIAAAPGL